jgi:protein O-mannosyl-transferase
MEEHNPKEQRAWFFSFSGQETIVFLCTLLFLVVLLTFRPALGNDFVNYDDPDYVTLNSQVQQGLTWENFKWAFQPNRETANWHPLTWLSHMLDCQFFGLKPAGHHLTSVLLHAVNTVMLFLVFKKMTGIVWRSFFVAALFGLHPLHVESVAWVSERKDVLSTLFWLLTLWAYAKFVEESKFQNGKTRLFSGLALIFFALGLMSKPMLVTLPFVLLLLDYWPLGRMKQNGFRALIMEKTPFLLLAVATSVVTFVVQNSAGAVAPMAPLPLFARLGNALVSYCRYLGKIFWPTDLSVFYPHPIHWPTATILFAMILLFVVSLLAFVTRRNHPYLLFGWLWFVGTLVPVIGLVQVGSQAMADHYSYVPSIGVFVMLIWSAYELAQHLRCRTVVLFATATATIFFCIFITRQQIGYWRNSGTLFRHAIAVTENNYMAYQHLGNYLNEQGLTKEAIETYDFAIQIHPSWPEAYIDLGDVLLKMGLFDEAISQYERAIQLKPNNARAHSRLGLAWLKKNHLNEAINQLQESIRLNVNDAEAHNNLGVTLGKEGRLDEAIGQLEEAVSLKSDYAKAHCNLGIVLTSKGLNEEAIAQLTQALKLQPNYPEAEKQLNELMKLKTTNSNTR